MRSADNFNPEWGYLAPRPSFLRTARIALVATAIGATSGGAVVYALLEAPSAEQASVAARTLIHSPESAFAGTMAVTAPVQATIPVQPHIAASANVAGPAEPRSSKAMSTVQPATGVAALAEAPVATTLPPTGDTAATASAAPVSSPPAQRKVVRQQRATWPNVPRQQAFMFPYGGSRAASGFLPSGGFWQ